MESVARNGKEKYEMQRKIEPGKQMWLNFADLIHRRIPDRKGRLLPADLTSGTYDLRDLNPGKGGQLIGSELALDTTLGRQVQPDFDRCCGVGGPDMVPDIIEIPPQENGPIYVQGLDCNGDYIDISSEFNDWWSGDNSIAQVTYKNSYGAGPGATTAYASGEVLEGGPGYCTVVPVQVQAPNYTGPWITSIDPDIAMIGSNGNQITINGYNFGSSPAVNLPSGITSTGQGSTDTKIVVTVNIAYTATVGNNRITVTANGNTSNAATFQVDGPYHMIVQSDVTGHCSGCKTTVERDITYQVQNFGGTNAGTTWIGENIAFSGWSCNQQEGHKYTQCQQNYQTTSSGTFTDGWSMSSDAYTPAGCGFNVTYDHWQWCQHSPAQTLGTLTGYVHTDQVSENGVVSPNKIPTGTVIPF